MMPMQSPQGIHISGDGLALDGDHNEPCPRRVPAIRQAVARKRQLACCCRLDSRVAPTREPRAVPRQPGPDERLGDVLAVEIAPVPRPTDHRDTVLQIGTERR